MKYPALAVDAEKLFNLSVRYYWPALKQIFGLIVLFVLLKSLFTHIKFPGAVSITLGLILAIIDIYLFLMALFRVDGMLRDEPRSFLDANILSFKSCWRVYLVCIFIIAIFFVIFFLVKWIIFSLFALQGLAAATAILFFVGIPYILILVYLYLAIPLAGLHFHSWSSVFYFSLFYAQKRFFLLVAIYIEIVTMLIISWTHTRHSQWLLHHNLMEVTDLITLGVFLPLAINLTLLLIHDARLRISPLPL